MNNNIKKIILILYILFFIYKFNIPLSIYSNILNNDINAYDETINNIYHKNINNFSNIKRIFKENLPLSDKEIIQLHNMYYNKKKAIYNCLKIKTLSKIIPINFSINTKIPKIFLTSGYITSIMILDSLGKIYTISSYDIGNNKDFNVILNNSNNILLLQANNNFCRTNLLISIKGKNIPIILNISSGENISYSKVELQITELKNNINNMRNNQYLNNNLVLFRAMEERLTNKDFIKYESRYLLDKKINIWKRKNSIIIKTYFKLVSPQYKKILIGSDKTKCYLINNVPNIILSYNGILYNINI